MWTFASGIVVAALLVGSVTHGAGLVRIFSADPMLNKVVRYAFNKTGKKIDAAGRTHDANAAVDAQCTYLVEAALAAAGAKQLEIQKATPADKKLGSADEIYVWGRRPPVGLGKNGRRALPQAGWIIQFEKCRFEKKDAQGNVVQYWNMPHHTAIIKKANGTLITVLHQNAGGNGSVKEDTFDLKWLVRTTHLPKTNNYWLYIPTPK
jgi:hypothetical protein